MNVKILKYVSPSIIYLLAFLSFWGEGWITWSPMIFAWVLIPLTELFLKPDEKNMAAAEEAIAKKDRMYDYLLYAFVFLQFVALFFFLFMLKSNTYSFWDTTGKIFSMGLLCGTFGINIGHELGHRVNKFEQWLAKAALLSSLYMHFFIEHNKGHHKNVATSADPSSSRMNEPVYFFYFRTIIFSYISAWKIANTDMKKQGLSPFNLKNEMLQAHLIQLSFVVVIYLVFGYTIMLYYLMAAVIGILLLETVNYIEHYGLRRKRSSMGQYERAMPWHSWNSNHVIGRVMLFELSRHSDHHFMASKKYQILQHHADAPQLPTGYPGSMILSLIPPLWFYIMNKRIKKITRISAEIIGE